MANLKEKSGFGDLVLSSTSFTPLRWKTRFCARCRNCSLATFGIQSVPVSYTLCRPFKAVLHMSVLCI